MTKKDLYNQDLRKDIPDIKRIKDAELDKDSFKLEEDKNRTFLIRVNDTDYFYTTEETRDRDFEILKELI